MEIFDQDSFSAEQDDSSTGPEKETKESKSKNEKKLKNDFIDENNFSPQKTSTKIRKWFENQGWKGNPFVLNIIPSVFVGYEEQKNNLISCIEEKHKVCLIIGATGSGKTTAMAWLKQYLEKDPKFRVVFLSKPPSDPQGIVDLINQEVLRIPKLLYFLRPLFPHIKNINDVPEFLNSRFRNKHLIILCDEVHEADISVLQWFRVLSDQVENMSLILSGLPVFDDILGKKLETFQKRIITKISLLSLSEEETRRLIEKRIKYNASEPNPNNPFTPEAITSIYRETGGFPREILRLCDKAVNSAIRENVNVIGGDFITMRRKEESDIGKGFDMRSMPRRQREIIEAIKQGKTTPGDIIDFIDLEKYKSPQHAVRSVNNILQRLMKEGILERKRQGKTFFYELGPKVKSLAVTA